MFYIYGLKGRTCCCCYWNFTLFPQFVLRYSAPPRLAVAIGMVSEWLAAMHSSPFNSLTPKTIVTLYSVFQSARHPKSALPVDGHLHFYASTH